MNAHVIMVPCVIIPCNDDYPVFFGSIDKKMYFAITQYRKNTFLDGGLSVWIGPKKALKQVKVIKEKITSMGQNVEMVIEKGKFEFSEDKVKGGYAGTFNGRKIKIYQHP